MPDGNVETVRRLVAAWNERDLETILGLSDPNAEFVNAPTAVEPGTRRGLAAVDAVMRAQWDTLVDGRLEIEEIYDRGEEVLLLARLSRAMPGSDHRLADEFLASYRLDAGKVTRAEVLALGSRDAREILSSILR